MVFSFIPLDPTDVLSLDAMYLYLDPFSSSTAPPSFFILVLYLFPFHVNSLRPLFLASLKASPLVVEIESCSSRSFFIPRIASTRKKQKENPFIAKKNYLKAMAKNQFSYMNYIQFNNMLEYLVNEDNYELFREILKNSRYWSDFKENIYNEFDWSD